MKHTKYLLSSAYFPPLHYFSYFHNADKIYIENCENYIKQSFRNRCTIYSANGKLALSVPVLEGSFHKIPFNRVRIDYTKRWQQIHIGALESSYRSAPFFEYYYDQVREVISEGHEYLSSLNLHSIKTILRLTGIPTPVYLTTAYEKDSGASYDLRYHISPKGKSALIQAGLEQYPQVFSDRYGFMAGLSILDLLFNLGPDSAPFLERSAVID